MNDRAKDLSQRVNLPLQLGKRWIQQRLVLAPMTYLGHVALRELIAEFGGCGLLFSEMCSAKRILNENRYESAVFRWRDEELPTLVCQIVGHDPETMAAAARIVEKNGFFGVDINFGCSAAAICRHRCGAALLKAPSRAGAIVTAVKKAVSIPLFVKFRTGWKDDPEPAVELARRFEAAGADALTFHPRVAPDRRARPPRWEYIGRVKDAVSIPVFGNGNVFDRNDCLRMLAETGCDGVALGRIAVARPWCFSAWTRGIRIEQDMYLRTAVRYLHLIFKHFDERRALRRFHRFAPYFAANFRYGHTLNIGLQNARDKSEIQTVLEAFFKLPPEMAGRPNMNLLR